MGTTGGGSRRRPLVVIAAFSTLLTAHALLAQHGQPGTRPNFCRKRARCTGVPRYCSAAIAGGMNGMGPQVTDTEEGVGSDLKNSASGSGSESGVNGEDVPLTKGKAVSSAMREREGSDSESCGSGDRLIASGIEEGGGGGVGGMVQLVIDGATHESGIEVGVGDDEVDAGISAGTVGANGAMSELTVFLLANGAAHSEVSDVHTALNLGGSVQLSLWLEWRHNLQLLQAAGFSGGDLACMLGACPQLLGLDYEQQILPVMEMLKERIGLRPAGARRVIRRAPEILLPLYGDGQVLETIDVLGVLGFKPKHLKAEVARWPQLLMQPASSFFQLSAWLSSDEVGIKAFELGSLLRDAPWLAEKSIDGQLRPVVKYLQECGVSDMERVIRAYPQILVASIDEQLEPIVDFLREEVGLSDEDLPRVLQTFPVLFAVPLERMRRVVRFFDEELHIGNVDADLVKITRAFPSLLGLDPDVHMMSVVIYLKKLGVQNVGRFVSRLPPVLGYDPASNLKPKFKYLVHHMGLSVYDLLTFPAYFSYPLDSIIEPRTEFLKLRRRPITLIGLKSAIASGDAYFARTSAKVTPELYAQFKESYIQHRGAILEGVKDVADLVEGMPLGNLGGLSTSMDVFEVTGARQVNDEEVRQREEKEFRQSDVVE
ncbi:unnamed protein product [Chrysoparadoxa australica]